VLALTELDWLELCIRPQLKHRPHFECLGLVEQVVLDLLVLVVHIDLEHNLVGIRSDYLPLLFASLQGMEGNGGGVQK